MTKIFNRLFCKHQYHSRGSKIFYRNGKTMKKNIYVCFKCGKVKIKNKQVNDYSLDKVRV